MIKEDKEVFIVYKDKSYYCQVELALDIIGGKWKGVILWYLKEDNLRYSELKRKITSISEKILIKELKSLQQHDIVKRKSYDVVPPKVEYSLTRYGKTLIPIVDMLSSWGDKHANKFGKKAIS